jgi:hypothetical protein
LLLRTLLARTPSPPLLLCVSSCEPLVLHPWSRQFKKKIFAKPGPAIVRFLAQAYLWMISSSLSCWVAMEPSLALSN